MAAPGAPTNVLAIAIDSAVYMTWTAPVSDGGSAIVGYLVTPYADGVAQTTILHCGAPAWRPYVATNDVAYAFTVAAFNADGTGSSSTASSAVTPGPRPSVPSGYTRVWVTDFDRPNGRVMGPDGLTTVLHENFKALWTMPASHQSGTFSVSSHDNFIVSGNGKATFRASNTYSGNATWPYSSAYEKTVGSFFQPLVGRYEAMVRFPMGHSVWSCFWMDAGGSSSTFEIDVAEQFLAQTPGRASVVFHSPSHYSENMNGSAAWDSLFTYHVPAGGGAPFAGPYTASTRYGKKAFDWATTTTPNTRPWVKVACEVDKITGAAGYTIRIRIWWDDKLLITFLDPFDPVTGQGRDKNGTYTGTKPRWVQAALDAGHTENLFWDMRWDNWVGGRYIGDSTTDAGALRETYDGKLQGGTADAPYGLDAVRPNGYPAGALVPSTAGRWPLDMDVKWMQRLTKNP